MAQCQHKEVFYDLHFTKICYQCKQVLSPGKRKLTRRNRSGSKGLSATPEPRHLVPFGKKT